MRFLSVGFLIKKRASYKNQLMDLMSVENPSSENKERLAQMAETVEIYEMQLQCSMMPIDVSNTFVGYQINFCARQPLARIHAKKA